MVNEQECKKILNEGEDKFTHEEMLIIREFITTLAQMEFDCCKLKQNRSAKNECNVMQEGKYRRAGWQRIQSSASGNDVDTGW